MFWPLAKKMCRPLREPLPKTDLAAAAVAFGGSLHVAGFVDGSVHLWHWRKKTEVRAGVFFFGRRRLNGRSENTAVSL